MPQELLAVVRPLQHRNKEEADPRTCPEPQEAIELIDQAELLAVPNEPDEERCTCCTHVSRVVAEDAESLDAAVHLLLVELRMVVREGVHRRSVVVEDDVRACSRTHVQAIVVVEKVGKVMPKKEEDCLQLCQDGVKWHVLLAVELGVALRGLNATSALIDAQLCAATVPKAHGIDAAATWPARALVQLAARLTWLCQRTGLRRDPDHVSRGKDTHVPAPAILVPPDGLPQLPVEVGTLGLSKYDDAGTRVHTLLRTDAAHLIEPGSLKKLPLLGHTYAVILVATGRAPRHCLPSDLTVHALAAHAVLARAGEGHAVASGKAATSAVHLNLKVVGLTRKGELVACHSPKALPVFLRDL
mmetsp:Transcript_61262/g.197399  ORF Transcript_61262/g.197399 Transcript_61262/m.197399 type:complete len:358 (-) Transcript_61262:64-1137(-)